MAALSQPLHSTFIVCHWIWQELCQFLIYDTSLPVRSAQMELKLSEFLKVAVGERSKRSVGKSLLTHLSSSVRAKAAKACYETQGYRLTYLKHLLSYCSYKKCCLITILLAKYAVQACFIIVFWFMVIIH